MAQRQFRSDDTSRWGIGFGNGGAGAYNPTNSTWAAAVSIISTVSAGATTIVPSSASTFANGDAVLIIQSRGSGCGTWELNFIVSGGGSTSLTMLYPLANAYNSGGNEIAQVTTMPQYSSVNIAGGITVSSPVWDQNQKGIIAFLCSGTTTIAGALVATGAGHQGPGSGIFNDWNSKGEGTAGPAFQTNNGNANGSGGGGGKDATSNQGGGGGGGGGHSGAGSNGGAGANGGGTGGGAVGGADLTSMVFGGAGGAGGASNNGSWNTGSQGGHGGGIIVIFSRNFVNTGSLITAGTTNRRGDPGNGSNLGGSGGGAGGSILIKGQTVTMGSANAQGAPGSAMWGGGAGNGGNGNDGRIHVDYLVSVSAGSTAPGTNSRQDLSLVTGAGVFMGQY